MADFGTPLNPEKAPQKPAQAPRPARGAGIPLDPAQAPPRAAQRVPQPFVGSPVDIQPPATQVAVLRSVALGYETSREAPQMPGGMSSRGSNWIARDGGLTPRPGLLPLSRTSNLMWQSIGWIGESLDSLGGRFPVAISAFSPAWYSNGSWSALSQTATGSSNTLSSNTNTGVSPFADAAVYYNPDSDNFELCFTFPPSDMGLRPFTFRATQPTFSTMTGAPKARYVAAFDSRLVFAHIDTGTNVIIPQRVQWSVRGQPSVYTAPDGGAEDLLDARGSITRLMAEDDRLVVFFENELWQGLKIDFPFNFQFMRLDPTIGTAASWSVARTPRGLMFLGTDLNLYLLPRGGVPLPVGGNVRRYLQQSITSSYHTLAAGGYVAEIGSYVLTWPTATGTQGVTVTMDGNEMTWSPIGFDRAAGNQIRRWGQSFAVGTAGANARTAGLQRTLVADNGNAGDTQSNVFEFTSTATNDAGSAIDCRYLALLGNTNPTERQIVREVRVDYRAPSASSLSVRVTPDFGATYPSDTAVALPAAFSAQTIVGTGVSAVYPAVEVRVTSGHTMTIQGIHALVSGGGNG